MNKELRLQVWNKYGHRCAYCGQPLPYNKMQVDHIVPKFATDGIRNKESIKMRISDYCGGFNIDDINGIDNLMPSCRQCNFYKSAERMEIFRKKMKTIVERLEKIYIFKLALKFGIISINKWDNKFYFEKHGRME